MKKALIFYGGWDGHEPKLVSARFQRLLEKNGYAVERYDNMECLADREKLLGFGYAAIDLFLLPSLLISMNALLARPLSAAWINFLYFALNFVFLWAIFHRFLKRSIASRA